MSIVSLLPVPSRFASRRTLLLSALVLCAGTLTISACSSDSNPPDNGTLALAITPTSINVAQDGSGNSAGSITRGGSFTGPVTLSQSGAPSGVTVTFSPGLIPAGSTSAGISVSVGPAVAPGAKTITISAAGSGVTTATATLTVTVTAAGSGSVVLAPSPSSLTAAVGGAAVTSAIGISRTVPFVGAVALTVTGQPANVTATLTPASVPGGTNTSTLSVTAAAGAVNGTYQLVVRATGTGISDATATVPVTVTGGAAAGASFTFSPTPLPLTAGGASGTSTVTIARTGAFAPNGALNLVLSGAPSGLTASVAPNTNVTGTTATVTAQATGAVAAGTYDLTLTGTGTGIPTATATLPVTVSGGGGGGSFSVTFCAEDAPLWVAAQDGSSSGAWTRVTPTSGTTYQFSFPSGKGGVATVDTVGVGTDLNVIYATVTDFTAFGGAANAGGCFTGKTVNGSVTNVGPTEFASVSLGGRAAIVFPPTTTFTLTDVASGSQDLLATRADATTFAINKIILTRGLNPVSGSTLDPLNFGTQGFGPATATVAVTNLGVDTASVLSLFTGVRGSTFAFLSSIQDVVGTTPPQTYAAIPTASLVVNEVQQLSASATEKGNPNSSRTAGVYFTTVVNRSIAMGPKLNTPTVTKVVTGSTARPNTQLTSQVEYNRYLSTDYSQSSLNRSVSVFATAGYFGSSVPATWNVGVPDLSTAGATWNPNWGLANGTPIDWDVSAQGGAIVFFDPTIADGSITRSASISSGSTPLALRGLRSEADGFALQRRLLDVLAVRNRSPLR